MKKNWTLGLDEAEAKTIEADYKGTSALRARLSFLLHEKITTEAHKGRSDDLYSLPNWQLTQADTHGKIEALEYVLSLIKD